jgi:hypothetical protein
MELPVISTVTTTTVSTVSTVTTTVTFAASFALVSVVTLFALLLQKEVVSSTDSPRLQALGRTLNVAIVPLLLTFAAILVASIAEVLR